MQTVDGEPITNGMVVYDGNWGRFFKIIEPFDETRCVVITEWESVCVEEIKHFYSSPEAYYEIDAEKRASYKREKLETIVFEAKFTIHQELNSYVTHKYEIADRAIEVLSVTSKNRKCCMCGAEFEGREGAKYCSPKCRKQASRLGL